jgi:hypothetical protein
MSGAKRNFLSDVGAGNRIRKTHEHIRRDKTKQQPNSDPQLRSVIKDPLRSKIQKRAVASMSVPGEPVTTREFVTSVVVPPAVTEVTVESAVSRLLLGTQSTIGEVNIEPLRAGTNEVVLPIWPTGRPIHYRVYSKVGGDWYSRDFEVPTIGRIALLEDTAQPLREWIDLRLTVPSECREVWLGIARTRDLLWSAPFGDVFAQSVGLQEHVRVPIPPGEKLWARLWSLVPKPEGGTEWLYDDYLLTDPYVQIQSQPSMVVPSGCNSTLVSGSVVGEATDIRVTGTTEGKESSFPILVETVGDGEATRFLAEAPLVTEMTDVTISARTSDGTISKNVRFTRAAQMEAQPVTLVARPDDVVVINERGDVVGLHKEFEGIMAMVPTPDGRAAIIQDRRGVWSLNPLSGEREKLPVPADAAICESLEPSVLLYYLDRAGAINGVRESDSRLYAESICDLSQLWGEP